MNYKLTEDDMLVASINSKDVIPDDFPQLFKMCQKTCLSLSCKINKLLQIL